MLGKLARWLILLGYDTRFDAQGRSDLELLEESHREGRIFVTRDAKIPDVAGLRKVVLKESELEDQLQRLAREFALKAPRSRLFTRCTYCNKPLDRLSREQALPLVPPLVRGLSTDFFQCPICERVYWNGTHTERAIKKLQRLGLYEDR